MNDMTKCTKEHFQNLSQSTKEEHDKKVPPPRRRKKRNPQDSMTPMHELLWIDSSDASTTTSEDGKTSEIKDKSGNGTNPLQPTVARRPMTNSRTRNDLNVLDLNFNQFMACENANMPIEGDTTMTMACQHKGPTPGPGLGTFWSAPLGLANQAGG